MYAGPLSQARLPVTLSSLPAQYAKLPWEFVPAYDGVNENLLVLFHGLGDTPVAFARLARQMQLPHVWRGSMFPTAFSIQLDRASLAVIYS